jgi:MFS family permease
MLVLLFAQTRVFWLNEILLLAAGICMMMVFAMLASLVQLIAPGELRGRVTSIYMVAFRGGMPLGSLAAGWLVSVSSAPVVMTINGLLLSLVAGTFLLKSREVREL